jgi:putative exporter of polyketide antibiotics
MVAVAVASFALFDQWWLILLGVLVAAAVGWYSLGLYQRASVGAALRLIRGVATDADYAEIAELPASA